MHNHPDTHHPRNKHTCWLPFDWLQILVALDRVLRLPWGRISSLGSYENKVHPPKLSCISLFLISCLHSFTVSPVYCSEFDVWLGEYTARENKLKEEILLATDSSPIRLPDGVQLTGTASLQSGFLSVHLHNNSFYSVSHCNILVEATSDGIREKKIFRVEQMTTETVSTSEGRRIEKRVAVPCNPYASFKQTILTEESWPRNSTTNDFSWRVDSIYGFVPSEYKNEKIDVPPISISDLCKSHSFVNSKVEGRIKMINHVFDQYFVIAKKLNDAALLKNLEDQKWKCLTETVSTRYEGDIGAFENFFSASYKAFLLHMYDGADLLRASDPFRRLDYIHELDRLTPTRANGCSDDLGRLIWRGLALVIVFAFIYKLKKRRA